MIGRVGAGASGYVAILSDVTLPIVPMAIFCLFSLFAGTLVYFLPETRDLPLPDTLFVSLLQPDLLIRFLKFKDAVTMLKNNDSYRCTAGIEKDKLTDEHDEQDEYKPDPTAKVKEKSPEKNGRSNGATKA